MEELQSSRPSLVFRLFGGFQATKEGRPIEGLHRRQGERLLAFLVLHAPRWVEKEELASHFWGDRQVDDKDQNLRQSLAYIRQLLKEDAVCLESRIGAVRLVLSAEQADTSAFDLACTRGDLASLALAQQIAEEPLLDGWSDDWILPFRERYIRKLQNARARAEGMAQTTPVLPSHRSSLLAPDTRYAGGIVPLNSVLYVERACDRELMAALQSNEGIILIKGPRQTGKSSLLARGLQAAHAQKRAVFHTDFEQFAFTDSAEKDTLYLRLVASLSEQAEQEFAPERDWRPHYGAVGNFERFLRERLLKTQEGPILWTLDGVDRLFATEYYAEFFALLRGIHSKRATQPSVPWERLTLLLTTATEAHLYIRDLNQSPFNVGVRIQIADFSLAQCREAEARYGAKLSKGEQERLYELLGGHPYLLTRALQEMKTQELSFETLLPRLIQPDGPYHDHLEGLRRFLTADPELYADIRAIQEGRPCSDRGFFRLRSAGVVVGSAPEAVRPRCGLYAHYFARYLK